MITVASAELCRFRGRRAGNLGGSPRTARARVCIGGCGRLARPETIASWAGGCTDRDRLTLVAQDRFGRRARRDKVKVISDQLTADQGAAASDGTRRGRRVSGPARYHFRWMSLCFLRLHDRRLLGRVRTPPTCRRPPVCTALPRQGGASAASCHPRSPPPPPASEQRRDLGRAPAPAQPLRERPRRVVEGATRSPRVVAAPDSAGW